MKTITEAEQIKAVRMIADAIVDAVKASPMGAPAGPMYAAMMGAGCTLDQFNQFTGALIQVGKIHRRGDLFFLGAGK